MLLSFLILTLFLPLFGALIPGKYVPVGCLLLGTLSSLLLVITFAADPMSSPVILFKWMGAIDWGLSIDAMSVTMVTFISLISCLVHVYALEYMAEDSRQRQFMGLLSLFTFFMLILVTAPTLIQLFVGWEGVGVCSYFLIGFWFEKEAAAKAALRAFIMNRVGDFFFILGIVGHFWGTFPTFVGVSFLLAAMAKSAQIGFHLWLPGSMEGPTPVSALIHAATLVTAGIFLLLKLSPFLESVPPILTVAGYVGGVTALFGAVMAFFQKDLKRILAYSTASQLGIMMMAIGLGAVNAALFHLITHGFFKALLFLGAGVVIHLYKGEQDVTRMGALGVKAPVVYAAMLVGFLSLTGMPFFAGFFSKEMILEIAFHQGSFVLLTLALLTAFMTGLYATRVMWRVFHGGKGKQGSFGKVSPLLSTPLVILSLLSLAIGYIGYAVWGRLLLSLPFPAPLSFSGHITVWVSFAGIFVGYALYGVLPHTSVFLKEKFPALHTFFVQEAYGDSLCQGLFVKPFQRFAKAMAFLEGRIDHDGPMAFVRGARRIHHILGRLQTGHICHALYGLVLGLVALLLYGVCQ